MTRPDPREPRHCYKCGREIGPDETICEVCNRAGMATPSATQYHGTIVVAIIVGVVALAIWGSLALREVGPYEARVRGTTPDPPDGVSVTVEVENLGSQRGFASCRLEAVDAAGRPLRTRSLSLGPIPGGESASFTERIGSLTDEPDEVTITCS